MEKVKDIKKEDLIELGFRRNHKHSYEYIHNGVLVFEAYIHDVIVDTFFVMFSIRNSDIHIDSKDDLKKLIDVTKKNIILSWIV
tara:strand:- start:417 stop:668 length:252 start_codon:yes stop_codon:yes gene_type:complete